MATGLLTVALADWARSGRRNAPDDLPTVFCCPKAYQRPEWLSLKLTGRRALRTLER